MHQDFIQHQELSGVGTPSPMGGVHLALVFTDIEGSSLIWEQNPEAMKVALRLHDEALRDSLERLGGTLVKSEGDGLFATFSSPAEAARWCIAAQHLLLELPWPEELLAQDACRPVRGEQGLVWRGLRVRMGIYWGEAQSLSLAEGRPQDFVGDAVNRAARTAAAGHGGQVLVGESARRWLAAHGGLPERAELTDKGVYVFKGMRRPERLFELSAPELAGRHFPALKVNSQRNTNLGSPLNRTIGRERELDEIRRRLLEGQRCLTLLGPGGLGKTRLATEVGVSLADTSLLEGGVWFCDLTSCRTLEALVEAVALSIGVPLSAVQSGSPLELTGHALAGRGRTLLILDNVEQVAGPAAIAVARWLATAPELLLLCTSRNPLGIAGEHRLPVDSLSLEASISLFQERARALDPELSERWGADELERLGRLLEGLPLAIELAAGRGHLLEPRELLERLERRLGPIRGRSGRGDARHATLFSAIDWSWDLLDPVQRSALCQLSVFTGGFRLSAAEEVLAPELDPDEAMEIVGALVGRSLLRVQRGAGGVRYGFFEAIRLYAEEKLGDTRAAQLRHGAWCARFAEAELARQEGPQSPEAMESLLEERENLLAVLRRPVVATNAPHAVVLATLALDGIWSHQGPSDERLRALQEALPLARGSGALELRARLALGQAQLQAGLLAQAEETGRSTAALAETGSAWRSLAADAWRLVGSALLDQRRLTEAVAPLERSLELALGYPHSSGWTHLSLGVLCRRQWRADEARDHYQRARELAEACGDLRMEGSALLNEGVMLRGMGRSEDAFDRWFRALSIFRAIGDRRMEGLALNNLGIAAGQEGAHALAGARFLEARRAFREVGLRAEMATSLQNLALVQLELELWGEARASASEALEILRARGQPFQVGQSLGVLAAVCYAQERLEEAEHWQGQAVSALRRANDPKMVAYRLAQHGALLADLDRLDEARAAFAEVEAALADGVPQFQAAAKTSLGHLDLACARDAERRGQDGSAHRAAASQRARAVQEAARESLEIRAALRWLEAALAR